MKKKYLTIAFAALVFAIPLLSIVNGQPLTSVLRDLSAELKTDMSQRGEEQTLFDKDYALQHQRMVEVITESNELSILLYTQQQGMTIDLAYALSKVSSAYEDFNKDRRPYDRIVHELNIEIDRYARLIEALRRLPPVLEEIEVEILPDSLMYHRDSLGQQISDLASSLEKEVIRMAVRDSMSSPFVLDAEGERLRDSCILYASELLKMHAGNREMVIADSTHYQAAYYRMVEAYDYAQSRYRELERYVFVDGQTPFPDIWEHFRDYWEKVKLDLRDQYSFDELQMAYLPEADSVAVSSGSADEEPDLFDNLSSKGANSMLVLACIIQIFILLFIWLIAYLILRILWRFTGLKRLLPRKSIFIFSLLAGTFLYFMMLAFSANATANEYIQMGAGHINTFLWLLSAICGSLLLRVKPEKLRYSFRLYIPTFLITISIIICRITFIPDSLIIFLFPFILALAVLRQLFFSIREQGKAAPEDSGLGWTSLAIYFIAFVMSYLGYTFAALLLLIWWYVQLTVLLSIVCIRHLLDRYKERRLNKKVDALRNRITYVAGADRETLLFGATWLYDFLRQVAIPAMFLISVPLSLSISLGVFDFHDLYDKIFNLPFVLLIDKEGFESLRISGRSIIGLLVLFFVLRYFNRAVHAIWKYLNYVAFMRKHNRTSIRDNEINLSLGNSIISVIIWMAYVIAVVWIWRIPTGSLTLVAGGLSAGIGLALKDIINNFIYGIQLMGGRLRVGDWIECDGVRGRVVAINYQCVVVDTVEGTEMSFLNASLFGKNFNNLTRNNSYEFTKIIASVAYGTDVKTVREVLTEAMQEMRTKDKYGREIVDPKYGVYVVVNEMSSSSVDIAVKQYVLVPERIRYIDRAKEVIYEALNKAGITIPFPQCDVHLIQDDK